MIRIPPTNIAYAAQLSVNDVRDSVAVICPHREMEECNPKRAEPQGDEKGKDDPKNAVTTVAYLRVT